MINVFHQIFFRAKCAAVKPTANVVPKIMIFFGKDGSLSFCCFSSSSIFFFLMYFSFPSSASLISRLFLRITP